MDLIVTYLQTVFGLLAESAPYLLLGFVLAGLLKVLVPEEKVYRHLGGDNFKSVGLASLFGIPIPLCSCSVLPTAMSLKRSGASKGATAAFLISTPETGLDSIGITYALLDPIMTVMRPVGALFSALVTGSLVNLFVRRGWDRGAPESGRAEAPPPEDAAASCCEHTASPAEQDAAEHSHEPPPRPPGAPRRSVVQVVREALSYSFGPLLDDLTPWFILGFLISGVIAMAVPDGFFEDYMSQRWLASLLMLVVGTPVYICAAATTPVAAALIAKGLDPGAALVLLLVGPATNASTILVVHRFLGKTVLWIYLATMTLMALVLGVVVNFIYDASGLTIDVTVTGEMAMGESAFTIAAALLILVLLVRSARHIGLVAEWGAVLRRGAAPLGFDPTSRGVRWVVVLLALALYLSQGISVVKSGEVGWVLRFGRVVRTRSEPGPAFHLPPPFERFTSLRADAIQSVDVGFLRETFIVDPDDPTAFGGVESEDSIAGRDLEDESEIMTGNEGLLKLSYSVHFQVQDAFAYQFRLAAPDEVVRAFAEAALRQVMARMRTDDVLLSDRDALESEIRGILQRELTAAQVGVAVQSLALLDIHAPASVHFAFRDVASSLEDKEKAVRQAEGYEVETLAAARADAYLLEQEAESYQRRQVLVAEGEAEAFRQRLEAYRDSEDITRRRMFFEAQEQALQQARVIFLLGDDIDVQLMDRRAGASAVLGPPDPQR